MLRGNHSKPLVIKNGVLNKVENYISDVKKNENKIGGMILPERQDFLEMQSDYVIRAKS